MTVLLFEILRRATDIIKDPIYCQGCSDVRWMQGTVEGCWSYHAASVVEAKFRDGTIKYTMNCYHHKPELKQPSEAKVITNIERLLLKHSDDEMPFTQHTVKELFAVLEFFALNYEMCLELFDAFLHRYRETGDLYKALEFARNEWDV